MNIRFIRNSHIIKGNLYNGGCILEKEYYPSEFEGINIVRYFIYNPELNQRLELMPEKKKYDILKIKSLNKKTNMLYFTTIFEGSEGKQNVCMYRYNIHDEKLEQVYRFKADLSEYNNYKRTRVFILNDFYLLFQNEYIRYNLTETYKGYFEFEQFLYCVGDGRQVNITDENLRTNGIESIKLLENNLCVIKTGFNLMYEMRYEKISREEASYEKISFINLGQLVSEILLNQGNIAIDTVDQAYYTETFPYMVAKGNYIVYSKVNLESHEEQVTFYDTVTKETTVCINSNIYSDSDLAWSYLIDKTPYIRLKNKNGTQFYNLLKNTVDIKFSENEKVETVVNGVFIVSYLKKQLFRQPAPYIAVYRYPDKVLLHQEKGEYTGCIATDRNSVYILSK